MNTLTVLTYSTPEVTEHYFTSPGKEVKFVSDMPPKEREYDGVFLENLLNQARRRQIPNILEMYVKSLKIGGRFVTTTPSLEWASKELYRSDEPDVAAYMAVYGDDSQPNLSGFTLNWLRALCEEQGLKSFASYQERVKIDLSTGKEIEMVVNVYIGDRVSGTRSALPEQKEIEGVSWLKEIELEGAGTVTTPPNPTLPTTA